MASNYTKDCNICGTVDLDDEFITDSWLIDRYSATTLNVCGSNSAGQLGRNSVTSTQAPIIIGNYDYLEVNAGNTISHCIKSDRTLWSCGNNTYGSLGNGTVSSYSSPIQIGNLTNWKNITGTEYTIFSIKTDGTLWGWGANQSGQLGNGTTVYYSSPIQIGNLTNWKQIWSGTSTFAIKTDGTLWAWGQNNLGQLGNGNITNYSSPIQIGATMLWKSVSYCCATQINGTLWAWGSNLAGRIGNGTTVSYSSPIQIGSGTDWQKVFGNTYNTFLIKNNNSLWGVGYNDGPNGVLGNGTTVSYSSPIQIGIATNWKNISSIGYSTIATRHNGEAWGWGSNANSQLMLSVSTVTPLTPVLCLYGDIWKTISQGTSTHTLALKKSNL